MNFTRTHCTVVFGQCLALIALLPQSGCSKTCGSRARLENDICYAILPDGGADQGDGTPSASNAPGVEGNKPAAGTGMRSDSAAQSGNPAVGSAGVGTGPTSPAPRSTTAAGTGASSGGTVTPTAGSTGAGTAGTGPANPTAGSQSTPPPAMADPSMMSSSAGTSGAGVPPTAPNTPQQPACDPVPEQCDGADNDCDMKVDEQVPPQPCGNAMPPCKQGTKSCVNGTWSTQCIGSVEPMPETCDGIDNDCNGAPDEGCDCKNGEQRECGMSDRSPCRKGSVTCTNGKWPTNCPGEVGPSAEQCDGLDNDCNGTLDDGGDRLCSGSMPHCDGRNGCVACKSASDCKSGVCQTSMCVSGSCRTANAQSGTQCTAGGTMCNGSGKCVACLADNECAGRVNLGGCERAICTSSDQCGKESMCKGTETCNGAGQCVSTATELYSSCVGSTGDCGGGLVCSSVGVCTQACDKDEDCPSRTFRGAFCYNQLLCEVICSTAADCPAGYGYQCNTNYKTTTPSGRIVTGVCYKPA